MNNYKSFIESTSPWLYDSEIKFTDEELSLIKKYSNKKHFLKGSVILNTDKKVNQLMIIEKGIVRYCISNAEGIEKTIAFSKYFLALEAIFHNNPILYYAIALEDVDLYIVKKHYLEEVLSITSLNRKILKALSFKSRILGWQINDLSFGSVRSKLCRVLSCYILSVNDMFIKLTHNELAIMTGLHRVTITRTLSSLKKEGIIEEDDDSTYIYIKNIDALVKEGFGEI